MLGRRSRVYETSHTAEGFGVHRPLPPLVPGGLLRTELPPASQVADVPWST